MRLIFSGTSTNGLRFSLTIALRCARFALSVLLLSAMPSEAGFGDWLSKKAKETSDAIADSKAGSFVSSSKRNQRDKERVLRVLSYEGAIYFDEKGKPHVKDQRKLDSYYRSLQSNKALKKIPGYSEDDDPDGRKSGQFWRNFLDGKDHTRGDLPATLDPFENDSRGLATTMHSQLSTATDAASTEYSDAAGDLKVRGIDILEQDLRQGVAAGADLYIKALDAMTGGTSSKTVEWAEEAAQKAKEISEDPSGAAKEYLKGKIQEEFSNKMTDALKESMGEDRYEEMMEKYEKYGSEQARAKKMMEDMYKVTGDRRFKDAMDKLGEYDPDKLAEDLQKKILPPALGGEKIDDEKEKTEEEDPDVQPPEEEKEDDASKDASEKDEEKPAVTATDPAADERDTAGEQDVKEEVQPTEESDVASDESDEQTSEATEEDESSDSDSGGSRTVELGYAENKDGRTTVTETYGADGKLIKTSEVETDSEGRITRVTEYEKGRGQGKVIRPKDLRSSEVSLPNADDIPGDEESGDDPKKSGLDAFTKNREEKRQKDISGSQENMKQQAKVSEASNEGNIEDVRADIARNTGGQESQDIQRDATDKAAADQQKNSWGTEMADSLEKGITSGIQITGAKMGQAVAKEASKAIFGDPEKEQREKEAKAKVATAAKGGSPSSSSGSAKAATGGTSSSGKQVSGTSSGKSSSAKTVANASGTGSPSASSASSTSSPSGGSTTSSGNSSPTRPDSSQCPACACDEPMARSGGMFATVWDVTFTCVCCGYSEHHKSDGVTSTSSKSAPTSPTPEPKPKPKPAGKECPYCGEYELKFVKRGNGWDDGGSYSGPWSLYLCGYCHKNIEFADDAPGTWTAY